MRSYSRILVLVFLVALAPASALISSSFSDSTLSTPAKRISIPGIPNAGKINEHLYRGAQPRLDELSELRKLGVTTVIDLRAESAHTAEEERSRVEAMGMRFQYIPIGGFSNPSNSDLIRFFEVIRDSPTETVFVHCEFGRDRTGVMIAAYRIAFEHWSSDQALMEMMQFGFNSAWHPSMMTFVRNLPIRLQSDERLKNSVKPN